MISEHIIGGPNYLIKEAREASLKRQHYNCKLNDKQKAGKHRDRESSGKELFRKRK